MTRILQAWISGRNLLHSTFQLHVCSRAMKCEAVSESSIKLQVSLPSGRCVTVSVLESGTVADLKIAAQQSLGQPFLRLAAPDDAFRSLINKISWSFCVEGWRQPCCCCTAAKDSCNKVCVCFVVSRKWQSCHVGPCRPWWWQLQSPRSAQECPAGL